MPPVKDEEPSTRPLNTSTQIQQIFSEVQLQLPSVSFDSDNDDDDGDGNVDVNDINEELILESNNPENTDALLESLSNHHSHSFLTVHPRIEAPQQPPSVESQMRVSPNLFDHSLHNQDSPSRSSFLSMDLFNSIDFDKLPSLTAPHALPQQPTLTPTFNRPRPTKHHNPLSPQQTNTKNRDDRLILERLAQQANKLNGNDKSHSKREHHPFKNLESALDAASHEQFDRHGKRIGIPESQRKTIYIDLRNSNVQQPDQPQHEQPSVNLTDPSSQQIPSPDSESDDDEGDNNGNDGMLWFEKRQQAKQQQQQQSNVSKD